MSGFDSDDDDKLFDNSQGLKLLNPVKNEPKRVVFEDQPEIIVDAVEDSYEEIQKEASAESPYDFKFSTGSFLVSSAFEQRYGFDDGVKLNNDDDECDEESRGDRVDLNWDPNVIFKGLACEENKKKNDSCALRMLDLLTNYELMIQKMQRQLIEIGSLTVMKTPEEMRNLGLKDTHNLRILNQTILSLQSSAKLFIFETEDLQTILFPPPTTEKSSTMPYKPIIGAFVALTCAAAAYKWWPNISQLSRP